jgi:transcriptional regulator with XRE-family HTH domain
MGNPQFGYLLRELRMQHNITLREFSRLTKYDASNLSKIERGIIQPPPTIMLKAWASHLKLEPKSQAYYDFLDTAQISRDRIPSDAPAEVRNILLPALLRTFRSNKLTKEEYERLVKLLNK